MIWIKEKDEIVGYVPILEKRYSDDEIREMSKYCQYTYKGWSKLSGLVMHLQGISYGYINNSPSAHLFDAPSTLYDVVFDFNYECFFGFPDFETRQYINQIFDVFENLTLYKVAHYSISDLKKQVGEKIDYLSFIIEDAAIQNVRNSFEHTLSLADANAKNMQELFKLFSDNGLILHPNFFQEANNEMIEGFKQPRINLRTGRLIKSIHDEY